MKDEKWKAGNEKGHDDSVEVVTNILPDLKEESVGLLKDQSHHI